MNICILGSLRDYSRMQEMERELRAHGHKVMLPIDDSEARFTDAVKAKHEFMKGMFKQMNECDAVLAVNDAPRGGMEGYIGPNTFLQLGMAMSLNKMLFCLAKWDPRLSYNEELQAMGIQLLDLKLPF